MTSIQVAKQVLRQRKTEKQAARRLARQCYWARPRGHVFDEAVYRRMFTDRPFDGGPENGHLVGWRCIGCGTFKEAHYEY